MDPKHDAAELKRQIAKIDEEIRERLHRWLLKLEDLDPPSTSGPRARA